MGYTEVRAHRHQRYLISLLYFFKFLFQIRFVAHSLTPDLGVFGQRVRQEEEKSDNKAQKIRIHLFWLPNFQNAFRPVYTSMWQWKHIVTRKRRDYNRRVLD
jgi:hypothetical protein